MHITSIDDFNMDLLKDRKVCNVNLIVNLVIIRGSCKIYFEIPSIWACQC